LSQIPESAAAKVIRELPPLPALPKPDIKEMRMVRNPTVAMSWYSRPTLEAYRRELVEHIARWHKEEGWLLDEEAVAPAILAMLDVPEPGQTS
jgi:hypothetical protein